LWHIDPFLGNDHETNNKTRAVAKQQIFNKQQLNYNNRGIVENGVFYLVRAKGLLRGHQPSYSQLKISL
jgi:hypothetical protein